MDGCMHGIGYHTAYYPLNVTKNRIYNCILIKKYRKYKYCTHMCCQQFYNSELDFSVTTMNTATIITLIALRIMLVDTCPIITPIN